MSNNETSPSLKTSPRPTNRGRVLQVLTAILVLALSATACAGTGRVQLVAAEQPVPAPTEVAAQPIAAQPIAAQPIGAAPAPAEPSPTQPTPAEPTQPETTSPVTEEPATTNPGTTQPETTSPVTEEPATTNPGTTEPGTTNPGIEGPAIPCDLLPDLPWAQNDPSAPVLPSPERPKVSIPCLGDVEIPDPGTIEFPEIGEIIPGPTPEPVPETVKMSLRPDTGIDGWAWSSNDTFMSWTNAQWRYNPTHYRVSTELSAPFPLAANEKGAASAGGRRRFTPPQPNGLWLNIDAHLSGVLFVSPAIGAASKVTVVARIQTTRTGSQEPQVEKEIELYSYEVESTLDLIGDLAQTKHVSERLQINEALPPLEMGVQYHMELEVRCETKALLGAYTGGFCSFGLNALNAAWDVPVPVGEGLILNDAYLSYVRS